MQRFFTYLHKINSDNNISLIDYLLLFAIVFIALFYGFASYAIENMNEGLYAEIPREMLAMGNYIIPHLNFVPYLEKPPLMYWLIALSYHLFGISTFSARLIPVTAAAVVCFTLYFFAKALNMTRTGWIASIVLATSIGFILVGRVIIFDMVLTAMFTLSLIFFYLWYNKENKFYLRLAYAFIGFAFLTKGLLALVLIPGIALSFMLINRTPAKKIITSFDFGGILLLFAIILPWIIAASIQQTGFAWDYFINEQLYRFLNKRIPFDYHTGPFYFYILPLLGILLPWSFLLPFLLKSTKYKDIQISTLQKFLWIWFLVPFVFFSLSQAKAQYYIIISIPPLALLLGIKINEYIRAGKSKTLFYFFIILMLLGILLTTLGYFATFTPQLATWLPYQELLTKELTSPLLTLLLLLIGYTIFGIVLHYFYPYPKIQFLLIAGIGLCWVFFFLADKQRLQPVRSEIALAQYIANNAPDRPIYLYQDYESISSILFYAKKRLPIIDTKSQDLYFGSKTMSANGWFISNQQFIVAAKSQAVYIILLNKKFSQFINAMTPVNFCEVIKSGDTLLLSNQKSDCQSLSLFSHKAKISSQ